MTGGKGGGRRGKAHRGEEANKRITSWSCASEELNSLRGYDHACAK